MWEYQYDEDGNVIGKSWVADETPSYTGLEGTIGDQAGDFPFRSTGSGLVNVKAGDEYANTPYDPSQGTGQGLSFTYDPNTGQRTYYKAGELSSGYYNPGAVTSGGIKGVSTAGVKNLLSGFLDKSGNIDLLKAFLGLAALKSMRDQQNIQRQARGFLGSPDLTRVAVQPTNVIPTRAYGAGAVGQPYKATTYAAEGGIMGLARGGSAKPPRYLDGPTDGMADKINTDIDGQQPAKLSHGEFVIPADVVSHLGNGNSQAGANVLYKMMDRVRKARTGTKKQGKQINPAKFMPGGIAGYAGGGAVAFEGGGGVPSAGTSVTSNLSEWAGPYVTNMLSQANALGDQPYQAYTGPLTAGTSPLQQQAFTGYANLQTPSSIGQAAQTAGNIANRLSTGFGYSPTMGGNQFQAPGAYQTGQFTNQYTGTGAYTPTTATSGFNAPGSYQGVDFTSGLAPQSYQAGQFSNQFQGPSAYQTGQFNTQLGPVGSVQSYMNPYIQGVTDIEAREARRQAAITGAAQQAQLAQAGAYGGSRDAIMRAELARNLGTQIGDITSRGLNTAYDKALAQRAQEAQMGLQAQQMGEQSRQFGAQQGMTGAQLAAQYGLAGQQLGEQSRQFGATQGLQGLQMMLDARKAAEASRQFGAGQAMTGAQLGAQFGLQAQQQTAQERQFAAQQRAMADQLRAQYGLSAQQAQEASRQFGAQQGMTAAQLGAQYGLAGQQLGEQSRQFGANLGLQGLQAAQQAAQTQGQLGYQQGQLGLQNLAAQLGAGAQQSGIEQAALDAQRAQFEEARAYPYKQLQFKQSMLSGLPISTQNAVAQTTGMQDIATLLRQIYGIGASDTGVPTTPTP